MCFELSLKDCNARTTLDVQRLFVPHTGERHSRTLWTHKLWYDMMAKKQPVGR